MTVRPFLSISAGGVSEVAREDDLLSTLPVLRVLFWKNARLVKRPGGSNEGADNNLLGEAGLAGPVPTAPSLCKLSLSSSDTELCRRRRLFPSK